jgi:rhodanese-related sulfurtransferase
VQTVVPEVTNKLSASDMRAARIAARKAGGGAPAPEAVVPDVVPEVPQVVKSVKVPETTGKFEIPSEWLEATPKKVELPKVEVKVEPPKIEMPKLEMPKIQMPEVPEVPEVKVSGAPTSKFEIPAEWLEATPKKVEVPKVEPPKIEMPKLEMPKIEMPEVPETVVPEVTKKLSASEMRAARLAARQAEGGAAAPESVVPEVVKAVPKVPEAPTGKFEIPSEWLEATPKKVEVPKVEVPKVEVPKLEVPKVEVPKIEIPTPPKIDIPAPEADVPIPKAKVEIVMPDGFELPMAPKAATPQIPDVTLPEMKVELPKVELPKVELPTAAVSDALSGFKSQLGASADAAKQAASKAGGGLSQEFNKELGGAVDAVNKVKGAAADAVGNATSTVTSSVNAQADAISSSVGKSLSTGAAFVAQFLPAEIVELLSKATGDPDLAVAITATFVGTPVVALLLIKVVGSLGFAGTKTPQETEAALYAGNALLLDVRSVNELVSQGVPDLRGKARGKATVYGVKPLDAKVRGKVKSAGDVEVSIFAYGARALAKGRPVYLLSSGGGGQVKTLARALSKVGCKAYAVDGGMKGWAKAGLRTKDSYMVSVADVIKEEAEELAAPLLQCVPAPHSLSLSQPTQPPKRWIKDHSAHTAM